MSSERFLAGMRRVAGAVTVVTTISPGGHRRGLTATAVCSLSATPPTLIVCVNRKTWVGQIAPDAGVFAVNVLSHSQEDVARAFAGQTELSGEDRFSIGDWETRATGAPVVKRALASFECRLERVIDHATHLILIGEVVATILGEGQSLIYLDGGFSSLLKPLSAA